MWIYLLYFVQTFLWMFGIFQLKLTEERKKYIIMAAGFGVFLFLAGTVGFGGNEPPVWMAAACILMILLFEESKAEILLKYLFSIFYMGLFSEPIRAVLEICGRYSVICLGEEQKNLLVDVFLILILILISWNVKRHGRWKAWIKNVPLKYYGIGFVAAFCASGVGSFSASMMEEMPKGWFVFYRIISMLLEEMVYLAGIFIAYLADLNRRYQKESALKGELLEQSKAHFITLERQVEKTRKIRHDMKFHLRSLQILMNRGEQKEALEYLETILGKTESAKRDLPDVGNQMVNAILESEINRLPEEIRFDCRGSLRRDICADDFDLCAILANLLSNAREACARLKKSEKKIVLGLKQYALYQVIEVENPIEKPVNVKKIGTFTSKKDSGEHGIGLLNVMETVEKNGGTISFSAEENRFRVIIHLKCKKINACVK